MKIAKRKAVVGASILTCLLGSLVGTYFYLQRSIGFEIAPGYEWDAFGLVHLITPPGFSKHGGIYREYLDPERKLQVTENSNYYNFRIGRLTGWLEVTSEETRDPWMPMASASPNNHQYSSATEMPTVTDNSEQGSAANPLLSADARLH